jgi:hypothetical protein
MSSALFPGPNCTSRFHMCSRWQPQSSDSYRVNCPPPDNGMPVTHPATFPPKNAPLDVLSLIHKFEAVSLQANAKISEQSPIRNPHDLRRHKARTGISQERNPTIFGPTRTNRSRFRGITSDGKVISGQGDVFNTPFHRYGERAKHHDAGGVYQTHISHGAYNFAVRHALSHSIGDSGLERATFAPHPGTRMTSGSRGSTVKEKIRFYESCTRNRIAPCKPHLQLLSLADVILS